MGVILDGRGVQDSGQSPTTTFLKHKKGPFYVWEVYQAGKRQVWMNRELLTEVDSAKWKQKWS